MALVRCIHELKGTVVMSIAHHVNLNILLFDSSSVLRFRSSLA